MFQPLPGSPGGGFFMGARVGDCGVGIAGWGLWVGDYGLGITGWGLRVGNYSRISQMTR